MTNRDHFITKMSNQELAEFLCKAHDNNCDYCPAYELCESNGILANGFVKWLELKVEEKMSDEYIRKADAIKQCGFGMTSLLIADNLRRMPPADVTPVVHSRWVLGGYDDMYYVCEKCGHKQSEYYAKPTANFCPNCGAKMDKEE